MNATERARKRARYRKRKRARDLAAGKIERPPWEGRVHNPRRWSRRRYDRRMRRLAYLEALAAMPATVRAALHPKAASVRRWTVGLVVRKRTGSRRRG